jgi:uncharacterized membrane protein
MQAFRWTAERKMLALGSVFDFDSWSEATGVSSDGRVIVGDSLTPNQDKMVACYWGANAGLLFWRSPYDLAAIPPRIDRPGVVATSQVNAVTPDGSFIVGEECGEAFLLQLQPAKAPAARNLPAAVDNEVGKVRMLGRLPGGVPTAARAVSADGAVVVGIGGGQQGAEAAIIWDAKQGLRTLASALTQAGVDLRGWRLTIATGISADGTWIVGEGVNPNGDEEGWLAQLPRDRESRRDN